MERASPLSHTTGLLAVHRQVSSARLMCRDCTAGMSREIYFTALASARLDDARDGRPAPPLGGTNSPAAIAYKVLAFLGGEYDQIHSASVELANSRRVRGGHVSNVPAQFVPLSHIQRTSEVDNDRACNDRSSGCVNPDKLFLDLAARFRAASKERLESEAFQPAAPSPKNVHKVLTLMFTTMAII
jgi:hypothetical protein